jgi:hypothetical protein
LIVGCIITAIAQKNVAVLQDVMSVSLLEDFPSLELPVEHFMSCTHTTLQFILFRVSCTCGTHDVIRSLADVPVISLYTFKRIKKMSQAVAKNCNVMIRTRKRSIDPDQNFPLQYQPQACSKTAFPFKLVSGKWVALLSWALLRDSKVCSIDRKQAVDKTATPTPLPILKYNLTENNCGEYFFALI